MAEDEELLSTITWEYNARYPGFAYICGGLRRIAVDPYDRRAQRMLLRKGIRYYSKTQFFIYKVVQALEPDVFLDVGANYGECLFSLPLHSDTTAIGFEPNAGLHPYLQKSIVYNDDLDNVSLSKCAVATKPDLEASFYIDQRWSGKSSLIAGTKARHLSEEKVTTTSVDNEIARIDPNFVLLKADVEGYEPEVFQGATETYRRVPNLVCLFEFDSNFLEHGDWTGRTFFEWLSRHYTVYELTKRGLVKVVNLEGLSDGHTLTERIHKDLVACKFGYQGAADRFESEIVDCDLRASSKAAWGWGL